MKVGGARVGDGHGRHFECGGLPIAAGAALGFAGFIGVGRHGARGDALFQHFEHVAVDLAAGAEALLLLFLAGPFFLLLVLFIIIVVLVLLLIALALHLLGDLAAQFFHGLAE